MPDQTDTVAVSRKSRTIRVGNLRIGAGNPIAVQSMCATRTQDITTTLSQIRLLESHDADIIRLAVDSKRDVEALAQIRKETSACLAVDLQENFRLAAAVAPLVQKIRYNPGHLFHHARGTPVLDKVKFIVDQAGTHGCAIRIGVNFGSLDPDQAAKGGEALDTALASAEEHVQYLEALGFKDFLVSLKSSDPRTVLVLNQRFAARFPAIPLHLGVTEAGMLPEGEAKTRWAVVPLLSEGIGDTLRVSLTLPLEEKYREVLIGRRIVADVQSGQQRAAPAGESWSQGLNIVSCPSCSRVENEAFVELAARVRAATAFAAQAPLTIAVMGCRVNGPGETDDADLGLWCAAQHVNLKRRGEPLGTFGYDEVVQKVQEELRKLLLDEKGEPGGQA